MTATPQANLTPADVKDDLDLSTLRQLDHEEGITAEISISNYDATQKSLVRKLDMTLMPIIFILYLFNYLDRNNIA